MLRLFPKRVKKTNFYKLWELYLGKKKKITWGHRKSLEEPEQRRIKYSR